MLARAYCFLFEFCKEEVEVSFNVNEGDNNIFVFWPQSIKILKLCTSFFSFFFF